MVQGNYICIHCGSFLPALYEQYGGGHIRLSLCQYCNNVADKYIEYDNVLLFIDLILIKPCAYRHTIYNVFLSPSFSETSEDQKGRFVVPSSSKSNKSSKVTNSQSSLSSSLDAVVSPKDTSKSFRSSTSLIPLVFRLGILMLLFEVYVTWAYQEKSFIEQADHTSLIISLVLKGPIQYIYFLSTTLLQNILLCLSLSYYGLRWLPFPPSKLAIPGDAPSSADTSVTSTPFSSRSPSPPSKFNSPQLSHFRIPSHQLREKQLTSSASAVFISTSQSKATQTLQSPSREHASQLYSDSFFMSSKPTFKRICGIMLTTVLISNIIKLFPIVMLIWPYDPPILHATRLLVRIVHIFLLIEALYIVLIDPRNTKRKSGKKYSSSSSNDYYRVTAVVLVSELTRIIVSHIIIVFVASAIWGVSVREIGLDDWKMLKVGIRMLEELGDYILGEA